MEAEIHARSIESPVPTLVTKANVALIEPVLAPAADAGIDPRRLVIINGALYVLDIRFRMLNNPELSKAMGFTDNEYTYEFVGNKEEVTRQIGNAVPVNMAAALVKVILEKATLPIIYKDSSRTELRERSSDE